MGDGGESIQGIMCQNLESKICVLFEQGQGGGAAHRCRSAVKVRQVQVENEPGKFC